MGKIRKAAPVILMVLPYLSVFAMVSPGYNGVLPVYIFFTVILYCLNIWNAWSYPKEDGGRGLAFWDMAVKLSHIPFYVGVFGIGILLAFAMVIPAFIIVSPILVSVLAVADAFLMLASSMYGISAVVRLRKEGRISKQAALLHIVLHLFFVLDVASAVCLYLKCKKTAAEGFQGYRFYP